MLSNKEDDSVLKSERALSKAANKQRINIHYPEKLDEAIREESKRTSRDLSDILIEAAEVRTDPVIIRESEITGLPVSYLLRRGIDATQKIKELKALVENGGELILRKEIQDPNGQKIVTEIKVIILGL